MKTIGAVVQRIKRDLRYLHVYDGWLPFAPPSIPLEALQHLEEAHRQPNPIHRDTKPDTHMDKPCNGGVWVVKVVLLCCSTWHHGAPLRGTQQAGPGQDVPLRTAAVLWPLLSERG